MNPSYVDKYASKSSNGNDSQVVNNHEIDLSLTISSQPELTVTIAPTSPPMKNFESATPMSLADFWHPKDFSLNPYEQYSAMAMASPCCCFGCGAHTCFCCIDPATIDYCSCHILSCLYHYCTTDTDDCYGFCRYWIGTLPGCLISCPCVVSYHLCTYWCNATARHRYSFELHKPAISFTCKCCRSSNDRKSCDIDCCDDSSDNDWDCDCDCDCD